MLLEACHVLASSEIGDLGTLLVLRAPGIAAQARAGQYAHVRAAPGFDPLLRRPHSFGRIDRAAGEIEILVRANGEWLGSRRPGDMLELLGPLGTAFVVGRSTSNLLLIAAGAGIAPMRVLAEQESARRNVTLVMGGRTLRDLWPASALPTGVEYVTTTEDGSFGQKGAVTGALRPLLGWADQLFASGPWPMLAALGAMRAEAAHASAVYPGRAALLESQVAVVQRIGCAMGVCNGCVIATGAGTKRLCREGPVLALGEVAFDAVEPATVGAGS